MTDQTKAEERAHYVLGTLDVKNDRGSISNDAHAIAEAVLEGALAIAAAIRTLKTEGE